MKHHVPKVDTYDDYIFMCGTHADGALVDARDLCEPCVKKTLEIVDLLSSAYDVLSACEATSTEMQRIRDRLLRRIDRALGKRPRIDYATTEAP